MLHTYPKPDCLGQGVPWFTGCGGWGIAAAGRFRTAAATADILQVRICSKHRLLSACPSACNPRLTMALEKDPGSYLTAYSIRGCGPSHVQPPCSRLGSALVLCGFVQDSCASATLSDYIQHARLCLDSLPAGTFQITAWTA